jgi:hypothetical protein
VYNVGVETKTGAAEVQSGERMKFLLDARFIDGRKSCQDKAGCSFCHCHIPSVTVYLTDLGSQMVTGE